MRVVIPLSILLGLAWNALVSVLLGEREAIVDPSWLSAGAAAGLVAGWLTVWSRRRLGGRESLGQGLVGYYGAMLAYWAGFVILRRVSLCVQLGGWTDFNLHDHLMLIVWFVIYGTLQYGILLIPLSFLTRRFVWWAYLRSGNGV